jgi:GT2 family glycosyltransferase
VLQTVEFIPESTPECSIIVLAWQLTDDLIDCLAAVRDSVDAPPFEVIVVVNGASDEVRDAVREHVVGASIVEIPFNVGFGGGCNAGASIARGDELIFLNDDTVVDQSWLANLCRTARETPSAGAVVSLLLNGDGTVQEAGSRFLSDLRTQQFGANLTVAEAEAAQLLEQRPVDYGSGAALLVRADLFRRIGGFDPLYEPAYYEDVDLQFRVKAAGFDVIFEPTAVVSHLSGGSTAGSPLSRLFRQWAAVHASTVFVERWGDVIAGAPAADAPLSELVTIPRQSDEALAGTLPTAAEIVAGSAVTAVSISSSFSAWLAEQLDASNTELRRVDALFAETNALREAERGDVARVQAELEALERSGPLGVAKRQFDLVKVRLRKRVG